jgi:hypothetical protein
MPKTGLWGPFPLTYDGIGDAVCYRSAGVFALGHIDMKGRFCVHHVGRSDTSVAERLRDFIGSDLLFKFGYFPSSKEAFVKECSLFHDFTPPGNAVHPGRPSGTDWECPRCRIFGGEAPAKP